MLLATVVLSAALSPAVPAAAPQVPATEEPAPPMTFEGLEAPEVPDEPAPSPGLETSEMPAAVQQHIDAGLQVFIRGRFTRAREEFEKAYAADPLGPAAAFYLGYACYKLGEPSGRMNADKQRARELFAKAYQRDPAFRPVWGQKKE